MYNVNRNDDKRNGKFVKKTQKNADCTRFNVCQSQRTGRIVKTARQGGSPVFHGEQKAYTSLSKNAL